MRESSCNCECTCENLSNCCCHFLDPMFSGKMLLNNIIIPSMLFNFKVKTVVTVDISITNNKQNEICHPTLFLQLGKHKKSILIGYDKILYVFVLRQVFFIHASLLILCKILFLFSEAKLTKTIR